MKLACNIDARGKAVRFRIGVVELVIGAILALAWAWPTGSRIGWLVSSFFLLGGAFSLFEARSGWCLARAIGFRTPM
jgi:hypothetical protein